MSRQVVRDTDVIARNVIHNLLAILDLRLQRWLNVAVPLPPAFLTLMTINYNAEGRLCAFCVTPGKQTTTLGQWRDIEDNNEQIDGPIALVTWRGPIGCVSFQSSFTNAIRSEHKNFRVVFSCVVPPEQLARRVTLLHNLPLPKS